MRIRPALAIGAVLLSACLCGSATAAKLYRWVDEQGNVHYSDRIPPDAAKQERARLDERGVMVERTEAAKTEEELARDRELERLRAAQQKLLEEQQERDRVLLNTFRTEDDLFLARDKKIEAVDAQVKLTEGNIKRLKKRLADMQATAATTERQGEQVSPKYRADIEATRRQIEEAYASIVQREQDRLAISARFEDDLQRIRLLRNLRIETAEEEKPKPERRRSLLDTLVVCDNRANCLAYWERATEYAQRKATTKLQIMGEHILMTAAPLKDDDLSLTVSRIPDEQGVELIFLDLQCRESPLGAEFCAGAAAQQVRDDFRGAVLGEPSAAPVPAAPAAQAGEQPPAPSR
jgi:hypothetical protein